MKKNLSVHSGIGTGRMEQRCLPWLCDYGNAGLWLLP